jgi:hypothetical protein
MTGTRTFRSWHAMIQRCTRENNSNYPDYGGRGIRVDPTFADPVTGIHALIAEIGERPEGMTLDRIDVDGDYEPGNVRWSTPKEQANNRRSNLVKIWQGKPITKREFDRLVWASLPTVQTTPDRIVDPQLELVGEES